MSNTNPFTDFVNPLHDPRKRAWAVTARATGIIWEPDSVTAPNTRPLPTELTSVHEYQGARMSDKRLTRAIYRDVIEHLEDRYGWIIQSCGIIIDRHEEILTAREGTI
jgi:hypothetical protein